LPRELRSRAALPGQGVEEEPMKSRQSLMCLTAVCGLTLAACAGEDDVPPGDEDTVPAGEEAEAFSPEPFEISSLMAERGISEAEAMERLGWQARVTALNVSAAERLGSAFGGVWIDIRDGDRIKVGVVTSSPALPGLDESGVRWGNLLQELDSANGQAAAATRIGGASLVSPADITAAARATVERLGLDHAADVVEVRRTWAELEAANQWLGSRIASGDHRELIAGIRTDLNAIELQIPRGKALSAENHRFIADVRAALGDGLVESTYKGRVEPRACTYPLCDPPLRGGIRIENSQVGCTGGFVARSKDDSRMYQFTAGHCVIAPLDDEWITRFPDGSWEEVGPRHNSIFGGDGDMAILRILHPAFWDPENFVFVTSGPDTTRNETYTITSEGLSVIGMRVCTTGGSYGRSDCGNVTHLDVTANYGQTVHGLGRGTFCGTNGDSGAPMYANHSALGLQVAGVDECDSLYQGILDAETKMNVNVLH
jgi:hypothetical protein